MQEGSFMNFEKKTKKNRYTEEPSPQLQWILLKRYTLIGEEFKEEKKIRNAKYTNNQPIIICNMSIENLIRLLFLSYPPKVRNIKDAVTYF